MPPRDTIHKIVKKALLKDGWEITDDPFVISYGERFLFVDLAAIEISNNDQIEGSLIGAIRANSRIAIEIKDFRGQSAIADLEQSIGQYMLYRLLLGKIDSERDLYLAVTDKTYSEIFSEPIGELVINEIPLKMLIIDLQKVEVKQWIPPRLTEI